MGLSSCARGIAALALAFFGFVPHPARAEASRARPSLGYLSLEAENDLFGNGADRHFTHGTAVNYFSEPCQFRWVERAAQALWLAPKDGPECERTRVGFGLGQAIYTPGDISLEVPDPHDRPYAGWLYLTADLVTEATHDHGQSPWLDRSVRKVELSLGVVGPASGAGVVQREYHKLIGAQEPRGWTHQLENEPALMISYEYLRRYGRNFGPHLQIDVTPSAGLSAGNVFTQGDVGLTFRIGSDMLQDYGPPRIRPSLAAGGAFFERPLSGFGWYIFAGLEGRAVAHNIFLDGNSFTSGPHVEKRHFVGDLQVGFAVTLGGVRLSYTNVFRTKEFFGQQDADDFGAITASFRL
jgi:lipid A 3-O-deacylase